MSEEIFGPVLTLYVYPEKQFEQTLDLCDRTSPYALTWTNDITQALRTAKRVQSGFVWVNGVNSHVRAVPFGGYKNSGIGRERGIEELYSYTEEKSVQIFL